MTPDTAHPLLRDTGLPAAWAGQPLWRVLHTGWGDGSAFLALWAAWLQDPARSARLHHVALCAQAPALAPLLDAIAHTPALAPLRTHAAALQAAWPGLLPGFHRLRLAGDQVQLTLCIAPPAPATTTTDPVATGTPAGSLRDALRELAFEADTVWLDDPLETGALKTLATLCRRGTQLATPPAPATARRALQAALQSCGFEFLAPAARGNTLPADGPAPLRATFNPRWTPRKPASALAPVSAPGHCIVVGSGLAGASAAYSLAQRGWQVTVLDRANAPAAGASGLPAGVVAPHVSPDDRLLSQLSRSGVRATLARAASLLPDSAAWAASGVLERRLKDSRELPATWADPTSPGHAWSRPADAAQRSAAALPDDSPAHWHACGGWVRAPALVAAMLAAPGITWRGNAMVAALRRTHSQAEGSPTDEESWTALAADGQVLAQAPLVVVAAGFDSLDLLASTGAPALPLNPLRGQLLWGPMPAAPHPLPPFPVNGLGNFITGVPVDGTPSWVMGSSFERGCREPVLRDADTQEVAAKLAVLLPASAAALAPQFASGTAQAWAAVRCTVPDRLPVVGALDAAALPGLYVSTGMGARGMTLAVLCGELLAAQLAGEPLPVPLRHARALAPQRLLARI